MFQDGLATNNSKQCKFHRGTSERYPRYLLEVC